MILAGIVFRVQNSFQRRIFNECFTSRSFSTVAVRWLKFGFKPPKLENAKTPIQFQIRNLFDFSKQEKPFSKNEKWFRKPKMYKTSKERNQTTFLYLMSLAVLTAGASYAAVPLYRYI